ncbi:MAG TPA: glycine/sarcosine/betaine reductase selenoprotein B family protein [Acetobacteraceae bacterium]|jgi:glycine/betaine/sarcosine/D-proline reductase family selenoprotein B
MTDVTGRQAGFVGDNDVPIGYMERTRDYYRALGYETPYRWAHYADVPFAPLAKSLARSRIAVITTAARFDPACGEQGPEAPYNGAAKFYEVYEEDSAGAHDLRISHIAYDRTNTTATDGNTWFPLAQLWRQLEAGRIGAVAPFFFGAPTNRSQRVTIGTDAPDILARCRRDGVDAAILVPNCPVCHQTTALIARHLEADGIATVVMGCAKDIVEHVGVPRFLFSDFPLGNSAGRPHDVASQAATLELALRVLEAAPAARTTVQSGLRWAQDASWKRRYLDIASIGPEERVRHRREFDRQKEIARGNRGDLRDGFDGTPMRD